MQARHGMPPPPHPHACSPAGRAGNRNRQGGKIAATIETSGQTGDTRLHHRIGKGMVRLARIWGDLRRRFALGCLPPRTHPVLVRCLVCSGEICGRHRRIGRHSQGVRRPSVMVCGMVALSGSTCISMDILSSPLANPSLGPRCYLCCVLLAGSRLLRAKVSTY